MDHTPTAIPATEEVERGGNFQVFEELVAADFVDHSNQRLFEEF